jgi:hypothetical protein
MENKGIYERIQYHQIEMGDHLKIAVQGEDPFDFMDEGYYYGVVITPVINTGFALALGGVTIAIYRNLSEDC